MGKKKTPTKPEMKLTGEPAYQWRDVEEWVLHRTGRAMRDWAGKFSKKRDDYEKVPYQDLWHWICDRSDIHNGCYFYLILDDQEIEDTDTEHLFIREIFAVLREEFPEAEGEMYCWVSW